MTLEISYEELNLLREILDERTGTLREEIYHTETPAFKDALRVKEKILASLNSKIRASLITAKAG